MIGGATGRGVSFLGLFDDKDEFYDTKIGKNVRIARHALAKIHISRRSFYRVKKKYFRPIDHGSGSVLIHESVKQRWDQDSKYRPQNLVDYF